MYICYGTLILRVDYNVLINYFETALNMKCEVNRRLRFCHVFQGHFKKIIKLPLISFFSLIYIIDLSQSARGERKLGFL